MKLGGKIRLALFASLACAGLLLGACGGASDDGAGDLALNDVPETSGAAAPGDAAVNSALDDVVDDTIEQAVAGPDLSWLNCEETNVMGVPMDDIVGAFNVGTFKILIDNLEPDHSPRASCSVLFDGDEINEVRFEVFWDYSYQSVEQREINFRSAFAEGQAPQIDALTVGGADAIEWTYPGADGATWTTLIYASVSDGVGVEVTLEPGTEATESQKQALRDYATRMVENL